MTLLVILAKVGVLFFGLLFLLGLAFVMLDKSVLVDAGGMPADKGN